MKKNKKILYTFISSRSEYYPAKKLFLELKKNKNFKFKLLLSGSLLSKKFGNISSEIKKDGLSFEKILIKLPNKSISSLHLSMSEIIMKFSNFFKKKNIEYLLIIGDRYESFFVSLIAYTYQIKIIHISGGEITTGSMDNVHRNAISNLSLLHLTSLNQYKKQLINMGIDKNKIYNVGEIGLSYLDSNQILSKKKIEDKINFNFKKVNYLITYHPNTKNFLNTFREFKTLLSALKKLKKTGLIFTYSNSDLGNSIVNVMINKFVKKNKNAVVVKYLGDILYRSVLKNVNAVIGNSSSGIWEVPSYKIPTLNIGTRQNGRFKPKSIIDCKFEEKSILKKIKYIHFLNNRKKNLNFVNHYYKKDTIYKTNKLISRFIKSNDNL